MSERPGAVNWGVLSTARIGRNFVTPAGQKAANTKFLAIASRDLDRARAAAEEMGIPRAYGSYDELLADDDVQAVLQPTTALHARAVDDQGRGGGEARPVREADCD